jgi:hypothetical protein
VLTQLGWPQRGYADQIYERRFGPLRDAAELSWSTAWRELELLVQQDHIAALGATGAAVALTSDVVSHPTALDGAGREVLTGRKIYPLGVDSLLERIPKALAVERPAAWKWSRFRPRRGGEGSIMDVEAVALSQPRSAGGLWVP